MCLFAWNNRLKLFSSTDGRLTFITCPRKLMAWSESSSLSPPHVHLSLPSPMHGYLFFILFPGAMLQFFLVVGFAGSVTPHYPSALCLRVSSLIMQYLAWLTVTILFAVLHPWLLWLMLISSMHLKWTVTAMPGASRTFALEDLLGTQIGLRTAGRDPQGIPRSGS